MPLKYKTNITIILLLSLFSINCLVAQERGIKIFNEEKSVAFFIKENKRIRLKTIDGIRLVGNFKVVDEQAIMIKDYKIKLSDIISIKKNPRLLIIFTNTILFYYGALFAVGSLAVSVFSQSAAGLLLLMPSTACFYAGFKSPNILKGYKKKRNWEYQIVYWLS